MKLRDTLLPAIPAEVIDSGAACGSPAPPSGQPVPAESAAHATDVIPELLTGAEVQAIFARSERALRDWARKGRLRRVKIGHSVFYLAGDVRRLVAEGLCRELEARTGKSTRQRPGRPCPEPGMPLPMTKS